MWRHCSSGPEESLAKSAIPVSVCLSFPVLCQAVGDCRLKRTAHKLPNLYIFHHVVLYFVACCTQRAQTTTWRVGWRYGDSSVTLYTAIRWSFWNSREHFAMCVHEHTNCFVWKSQCAFVSVACRKTFYDKICKFSGPFINRQACWKYMSAFLTLTPIAALRQPLTSLAVFILLCLCPRQVASTAFSSHTQKTNSWTSGLEWLHRTARDVFEVDCV